MKVKLIMTKVTSRAALKSDILDGKSYKLLKSCLFNRYILEKHFLDGPIDKQ